MDNRCGTLRFGEGWEKLELLRDLEETAKDCRIAADNRLSDCATEAERERAKPWREFRRVIGFPLFNLILEIARSDIRSEQRNLAADILAHLWHPAAVDRLVEDLNENAGSLLGTQISSIFINLAGIGNEVAARGLISLWGEGFDHYIPEALAACKSKAGEAFLFVQARDNKDYCLRGICICYLNSKVSEEKSVFLLEKVRSGVHFEQYAAVKKIAGMHLTILAPELMAVCNKSEDPELKDEIHKALRTLRKQ